MKICPTCKKKYNNNKKYCPKCGTTLKSIKAQEKKKHQIIRLILQIFFALFLFAMFRLYSLSKTLDSNSIMDMMIIDPSWIVLNILLFFSPFLIVAMLSATGTYILALMSFLFLLPMCLLFVRGNKRTIIINIILVIGYITNIVLCLINFIKNV